MKKLDLATVADVLFYSACAFVFSLCVMRYYALPLWIALLCAIAFALAAGGICFLLTYRKKNKNFLSKREKEKRETLLLHLALENPEKVRFALLGAYRADGREARLEGETLIADGIPVIPLFTMEPVGADAIALLIRLYGKQPFSVACNALSADAEKLLLSFGLKAERGDDIYSLFTRTGTTPAPLICGEIPRKTVKQRLHRAFRKTNARPFFISGALLLLMSLFVFFPLYYVIAGSVLLACAVAVRLFGYT